MPKPDQSELQLDQFQLPYSKHLGLVQQEAAQPNIAERSITKGMLFQNLYKNTLVHQKLKMKQENPLINSIEDNHVFCFCFFFFFLKKEIR